MRTTYEAYRYAADGHAGEQGDGEIIATGTLTECRTAIWMEIGEAAALWSGTDDDVEAYHDSDGEGCGGYAIRRAEQEG